MDMKFEGVYTAIITPFQKNGTAIDYGAYAEMLERQVAAGVSGVVPCGTTGESPTLDHKEHSELVAQTVKLANGRIAVIAGSGSNSTKEAVRLTEAASKDGADAVMLVNPYYNKPSQNGLYEHFRITAEASSVPVVLYNIKGRTAVNAEPETLLRLSRIPNIEAVKEASGDLSQMIAIHRLCGDSLTILSGDDTILPAVMGIGGKGVISVASNLYPRRMSNMTRHYLNGDFVKGNEHFYALSDLMNAMFLETNPVPIKTAAAIMGYCSSDLRLPLVPMEEPARKILESILKDSGRDE